MKQIAIALTLFLAACGQEGTESISSHIPGAKNNLTAEPKETPKPDPERLSFKEEYGYLGGLSTKKFVIITDNRNGVEYLLFYDGDNSCMVKMEH